MTLFAYGGGHGLAWDFAANHTPLVLTGRVERLETNGQWTTLALVPYTPGSNYFGPISPGLYRVGYTIIGVTSPAP